MPRSLGKIRVTPRGEYSASTDYTALDLVTLEGASYLALQDSKGKAVTDADYWQLVAAQGPQGETGPRGPEGPMGPAGSNGSNGTNGKDGTSISIVSIEENLEDDGTSVITFSDGHTLSVKNGSKGSQGEQGPAGNNGANGEQGPAGTTPERGVHYWTPEDIAEMQSYIDQKVTEAIAAQQPTE